MTLSDRALEQGATQLHRFLLQRFWTGECLAGPDYGVRFNWRVGRFVKSVLPGLPWSDDLVYMQAQGYWILANWLLHRGGGQDDARVIALACTRGVLARQRPEGYWEYPNPEWRGRVATVEGHFASLGLLESYAWTGAAEFLDAARRWYAFALHEIGFQEREGMLAINYFRRGGGEIVPNNTSLTLRFLARLFEVTGDAGVLERTGPMLALLRYVQQPSGELPYRLGHRATPHFLCYQYNAFQFLDIAAYYRATHDATALPLLERLAGFLAGALAPSGAARFDCRRERPQVIYYTAAVGAALSQATALGLGDFQPIARRALRWVLDHQDTAGGFRFFSRGDYGLLCDRRAYPRSLAMTLYHLLLVLELQRPAQLAGVNVGANLAGPRPLADASPPAGADQPS